MNRATKSTTAYLSKSLFIRGLQCHKSLYLHKFKPELKDEISDEQEARFQAGYEVGAYAKQLFPGGVEIPYDGLTHSEQLEQTKAEIGKGTATIYEAAFSYNGVFVKVDILQKGKDGWDIYEVKSSTGIKYVHLDDIAVQYYVVVGSGLPVSRAHLVHINNQYVRNGDIEPLKLFTIADVTPAAEEKQEFVGQKISELQAMLTGSIPEIDIGPYCDVPYLCDFKGHCWQHIPEDSVFDLRRKGIDKFALYRQGIIEIKDIPLDRLNRSQKTQTEAFIQKNEIVDQKAIKAFIGTLWHPMYFLDFETFYAPIPPYDGVRPYQQVPFQYSIHSLAKAEAELKHSEFIALPGEDPRPGLVEKLLAEIPTDGCIISYTDFETKRLRELAERFPGHKEKLDRLISNVRDLALPFKDMAYYHWKMNGSYSLKAVLPVLIPDMGYDGLEIKDGGMAIEAYFKMQESNDPEEIENIRRALLVYCKLDTLAMVKLLDKLREISA